MSIATDVARIEAEMKALREDFDQMADIVAQQAKIIRDFEFERQRRLGAKGMVKFVWGMLTTGIAGVAYMMHDILAFLFPPKGH